MITKNLNAREAAYLAVLASLQGTYIQDTLEKWRKSASPSMIDFHLAQEIAYGTVRMASALDFLARQAAHQNKLSLKPKEKALLRTAFYQFFFMDKIPLYAIVDETIKISKRHCHRSFTGFLNAVLRKLSQEKLSLPNGDALEEISIRYSYPKFFVEELVQDYGLSQAKGILHLGNKPSPTMLRIRALHKTLPEGLKDLPEALPPFAIITDSTKIPAFSQSRDYYIQNITPAALMWKLAAKAPTPGRILDLCAAPGGKILAAHDLYPQAKLWANDISAERLSALKENMIKYQLEAKISCFPGESFASETKFDLILLDVPCSNTGVLNKRPEARWRLEKEYLEKLEEIQAQLIVHAASLLAPEGEIWYMTCSLLKRENENVIARISEDGSFMVRDSLTIFPNAEGWDGGFGCAIRHFQPPLQQNW